MKMMASKFLLSLYFTILPTMAAGFELLDDIESIWNIVDGETNYESPKVEDELYIPESELVNEGPTIEIVGPDLSQKSVSPPFDIEIRFSSKTNGGEIVFDSLKILYIFWGKEIDITKKVLANATVDENRILAKNANIKKRGKQKVKVVVSDTKNRIATRIFEFRITG